MIRAVNLPFAFTPTSLWRAASVSVGALAFGIAAAPVVSAPGWVSAPLLATAFGALFLSGAGHSILHAVALKDVTRFRPANWSDGVTASAAGVLLASWAMLVSGSDPALLLLALGLGLNAAYVPAKLGCIEAGCCTAGHGPRHRLDPGLDLRVLEIVSSLAVLALAVTGAALGFVGAAAAIALGGHLAVRVHSRIVRRQVGGASPEIPAVWRELVPLVLTITLAAGNTFAS